MNGMLTEFKEVFNVEHKQMVIHTTMTIIDKNTMIVQYTTCISIVGFLSIQLVKRSGDQITWQGNAIIIDFHRKAKEYFAYELTSMRNRIMRMIKFGESYSMLSFPFCDIQAMLHSHEGKTSLTVYDRNSHIHTSYILLRIFSPFLLFSWENDNIDLTVFDDLVSYLV